MIVLNQLQSSPNRGGSILVNPTQVYQFGCARKNHLSGIFATLGCSNDGLHLPAKLVSQLRGIASKRNILVSLDNQHTPAHTTTPRALNCHWSCLTLEYCSIEALEHLALRPAALLAPFSCCCPALLPAIAPNDTASSAVPQRRGLLPALCCAPAFLDRPAPPPNTPARQPHGSLAADADPAPVAHISSQQHGQHVSVAICYQT